MRSADSSISMKSSENDGSRLHLFTLRFTPQTRIVTGFLPSFLFCKPVNKVKRKYEEEGGKKPYLSTLKNVFGLVYVFVYKAEPIDYPCFVGQLVPSGTNPRRGQIGRITNEQ